MIPNVQIRRGRGRPPKNPNSASYQQYHARNLEMSADPMAEQRRDFVCSYCGKTYLSNSALYLHVKLKHVQGEGLPVESLKRGRGRPRKDGLYGSVGGRADPCGPMFLKTEEREGGPVDILTGWTECVNVLFPEKYQGASTNHPLYQYLHRFAYSVTPSGDPEHSDQAQMKDEMGGEASGKTYHDITQDLATLQEPRKNMLNCETLFAIYLRECSQFVNEKYYKTMLQFVLMFRDCLNLYGWQKRSENECKDFYGQLEYEQKMRDQMTQFSQQAHGIEFTEINNMEFAPEICNEFVTVYMETPGSNLGRIPTSEIIDLTQHFCNWLFSQRLTCSKLSMVRN